MGLINISVCLSELPKEKIKVGSDGRKYINLTVAQMREPDRYEQTHTVFVSQSKEEREAREDKVYIGKGKAIEFAPQATTVENIDAMPSAGDEIDELPF